MALITCRSGKVSHPSREAALAHQKALIFKNNLEGVPERSKGLNVYPCPECADWHVGHKPDETPLVYHYTTGYHLDLILKAKKLRPRNAKKESRAINEPKPLLWFSWNAIWELSVLKDPRPSWARSVVPTGRAITELCNGGLVRFSAPAFVAKLRWYDYLVRNKTPKLQQEMMTQIGNPIEWLATDRPVPLSECRAVEVWYHGQWVDRLSVSDEEFEAYLAGRNKAYKAAWERLSAREPIALSPDANDAEVILFEDYLQEVREHNWIQTHRAEIDRFKATLKRTPQGVRTITR